MNTTTNKPSAIVLDFDFTAAHFLGGHDGLYRILQRRGATYEFVHDLYFRVEGMGFTIDRFIAEAERSGLAITDHDKIKEEFADWLKDGLKLYDDTLAAVCRWRAAGIPVVVLTFGDDQYQRQKISTVGLPNDEIIVVCEPGAKTEAIRSLASRSRYGPGLKFVEDKPQELDDLRGVGAPPGIVERVRILRPDSPYANVAAKHTHREVHSLAEVF